MKQFRCRPGEHSTPCGMVNTPYPECACGCSPSEWCPAQGDSTVTEKNWKKHSERLWALFLESLVRPLDNDTKLEFEDLKYLVAEYVKRTTHNG